MRKLALMREWGEKLRRIATSGAVRMKAIHEADATETVRRCMRRSSCSVSSSHGRDMRPTRNRPVVPSGRLTAATRGGEDEPRPR